MLRGNLAFDGLDLLVLVLLGIIVGCAFLKRAEARRRQDFTDRAIREMLAREAREGEDDAKA